MKRSYSSLMGSSSKRSKSVTNLPSITSTSLTFLIDQSKSFFIDQLHMPPIIFKHQLYSLHPQNRTQIDYELQQMFDKNVIRLFHSDLGSMLMFTNDYCLLIDRQLDEHQFSSLSIEKTKLKRHFIDQFLSHCIRLSVDRQMLENDYHFNLTEIQLLIQLGLLLPKDIDQYWLSIPNLAPFLACIDKARRTLLQMLTRRTYREIPMDEFRTRDTKRKCLLGFDFHIHDLVGANLANVIDTPTGPVVKKGAEKI